MKIKKDIHRLGFKSMATTILVVIVILIYNGCTGPNQSLLQYRLPYANGTDISVWQDHLTHSPANRYDLAGINGTPPYRIVAAQTGIIRFIVDDNTQNCHCVTGTCANNYVWIEHLGGEWSKYSHLATGSVRGDAGLTEGDIVVAGTFLGFESNIGRACGTHLHFEVGVPDDPAKPLKTSKEGMLVGALAGTNRIPRFCGVQGQILLKGNTETAKRCNNLLSCIRSKESPLTQGNGDKGLSGDVCVHEIVNVADTSTYTRGEHFSSSSVKIDLDWCPNANCDPTVNVGRAILAVFILDDPDDPNADPIEFVANCQNRKISETVHNVQQIIIKTAPNLSDLNTACNGDQVDKAFARWEICEVHPSFEE